jgi:hypothetical protein
VVTLGGQSILVYPGISGLLGVSEFTPDIPGVKAITAIFYVRGYKSPLHSFLSPLSFHFDMQSYRTHSLPPLLPLALVW